MTHEEAIEEIRKAREALTQAEHQANQRWQDAVSSVRAEFARHVSGVLEQIGELGQ